MAHLPARARRVLLVEMQPHAGNSQGRGEIRRRRSSQTSPSKLTIAAGVISAVSAQRKIAHGAHGLLKLAGHASALALVIAVVGARRKFVHQQFALAGDEDLHAEQAFDARAAQ